MTREAVAGISLALCLGFCFLAFMGLVRHERKAAVLCALLTSFWLAVHMLAST